WAAFLASAVSEWGFDFDFPLTPSLWLAVAAFLVFVTTAHAAIPSRIRNIRERETGTYLSVAVPTLSDSASSISNTDAGRPTAPVAIGPESKIWASRALAPQFLVCVTASDAIPVVIFLSPADNRGPPGGDDQIDHTLGH